MPRDLRMFAACEFMGKATATGRQTAASRTDTGHMRRVLAGAQSRVIKILKPPPISRYVTDKHMRERRANLNVLLE